jgi:hypothetical protein
LKITDWLAIYASILSTLIFGWNLLQSRPKIKVDILFGIGSYGCENLSGVYIFVRNLSAIDIHLGNISILYPGTKARFRERISHIWRFKRLPRQLGWVSSSLSNYLIDSGCPMCLSARQAHKIFIADPILEKIFAGAAHRSLIACVQDQLWNNVYSKAFKYPRPKAHGA